MNSFKLEPALIIGAVMSVIAAGVAFGLPLTVDQIGAIEKALAAVLPLVAAILIRFQVIPSAKVETAHGPHAVEQAAAVTSADMTAAGV